MKNRVNKPKVFFSHAWANKSFIERIAADLRRCGIDYWLDTEDIRDGRSWLKMIFEDGIPTCDAVIVYLTEQSIQSKMVQKELDAAVVQQLSSEGVTLLPYVSEAVLRGKLRSDIQSLQCREWNENNYESILPTVVAEIWRSYLERTVDRALLQEKGRRLELELENRRLTEQYESSVFSRREEQEFRYLYDQLGQKVEVRFGLFKKEPDHDNTRIGEEVCRITLLTILFAFIEGGAIHFDTYSIAHHVGKWLGEALNVDGEEVRRRDDGLYLDDKVASEIKTRLNTFGLTNAAKKRDKSWWSGFEISEKAYRFKYWIEFNNHVMNEPLDHSVTLCSVESLAEQPKTDHDLGTAAAIAADKKISQARRRREWSTNGEGTAAAFTDIQTVFDDLRERVAASNLVLTNLKLDFYVNVDGCGIGSNGVLLSLKWLCPSESLVDSCLGILIKRTEFDPQTESPTVFSCEIVPKASYDLQLSWYRKDSHGDVYTLAKIADFCWREFIRSIERGEEERVN